MVAVDTSYSKSDFSDHFGFVHAVRLPAGQYYVAPWLANHVINPVQVPRYDFTVGAGETVYLGEYRMSVSCSASTNAAIFDKWERDRSLFAQRNPSIDLANVAVRPLTLTGAALGEASR